MKLRWWSTQLALRVRAASKVDFVLNLLSLCAKAYLAWFPIAAGLNKYVIPAKKWYSFGWLIAALVFNAVYPLIPKPKVKKWRQEEIRRVRFISVAISQLTSSARSRRFVQTEFDRITQGLLAAIRSEVEALVLDTEGIYINVNLLVPAEDDPANKLTVLNRANLDRPVHVSYSRSNMLIARAMDLKQMVYEPDFSLQDKPYRSILALPLLFEERGQVIDVLGVVSIDSERPDHFCGIQKALEVRVTPYLSLLKLALVCREHARVVA
jgi:hypothetical protein